MIPLRLSLNDFLSYRQASLDFRGLQTACICGANGAGKSSLLEAITWVLWGQSRVAIEDDIIHTGASEVTVALVFVSQGEIYRVIRRRHREQSTVLEFQVAAGEPGDAEGVNRLDVTQLRFRSLTAKGLRATQQRIVQAIKLDYDTFVNSAYLRQGRADEFMLKRPNERKQVLADLLGLDQYEALAEQAKERARQHRAEARVLGQSNQQLVQQLAMREDMELALAQLEASLAALQQDQAQDQARRASLLAEQQQRQAWQQQYDFAQQQRERLSQTQAQLQQEQHDLQQQQHQLQGCLNQAEAIAQRQEHWQQLQRQDEQWSAIAQQHRALIAQRQPLEQQLRQRQDSLARAQERLAAQRASLVEQRQALAPILAKAESLAAAQTQLQAARSRLQHQEQLQAQVAPLLLRQQQLEQQWQTRQAQLSASLEALERQAVGLGQANVDLPQLQAEFEALTRQVNYLELRQQLQDQIREKGLERRSFLERLMAHRQDYESQIASLDDKVRLLTEPGTPCPLCDRPLDDKHLMAVQGQHERDRQGILDLLIVVRDQILTTEREIEVLRAEYRTIEQERAGYCGFLERRGQLQQQLAQQQALIAQQHSLGVERAALEQELATVNARERGAELQQLRASLVALAYDDRTHALARGEVERWRWVEPKQAELKQAQRRWAQLAEQEPELLAQQAALDQQGQDLAEGVEQQALQTLEAQLAALDYDPEAHGQLRQQLRSMQAVPLEFQSLVQAQEQMPSLVRRLGAIAQQQRQLQGDQVALEQQLEQLAQQLGVSALDPDPPAPDPAVALVQLESQMQQRRQRLDDSLAEQGRLQQRRQQLLALQGQYDQQLTQQQHCLYQQRIHEELAQAFGKNGIQTLLIENLLPQLERETNRILSRLSDHQLQVQFITQRAKRSGKGRSQAALMDTLDIRIGDAQGTRPYETYSGGEAFRVNFSIRLALARLLAQRSGTALQLLIVDEGFGTQDGEGCDRLIGAINAIAPDFACILTITHMPQFKEAFQARIEVTKGAEGSQLMLAV